jgi:hypothetical protein
MSTTTAAWGGSNHVESSLHAKMTAALKHQAEVEGVAINHAAGLIDVAVGLPSDLAGPELDIRYTWVQWNLESLIAHAFAAKGLRIGQVHIV